MSVRRYLIPTLAVLFALAAVAIWKSAAYDSSRTRAGAPDEPHGAPPQDASGEETPTSPPVPTDTTDPSDPSQRNPAERGFALRGRVRSSSSADFEPVPALVLWSPVHLAPPDADRPDGSITAAGTAETRAEGGRYGFASAPMADVDASVVVAAHTHHLARAARAAGVEAPDLVLEPCTPSTVAVVSEAGDPVPDAVVTLRGLVPIGAGPDRHGLTRTFQTDADGLAHLLPVPGLFQVSATANGTASELWQGTLEDAGTRFRLVLHETFAFSGRVVDPPHPTCDGYAVSARLSTRRWDAVLGRAEVGADGRFACPSSPWVGPGQYVFRLQGPDLCTREELVRVDAPGASIDLEFTGRQGIPSSFLAEDGEGNVVAGVQVAPYWWEGGRWVFGGGRLTDAEGLVRFEHLLPGSFGARTSKDGYVDRPHGPWDIVEELDGPILLTLQAAGRLTGRVLHAGQPVETFEVRVWTGTANQTSKRFTDRADGSFSLGRVPRGALNVHALTDDLPPCPPLTVEVPDEGEVSVVLELTDARAIGGRVLDVSTGLPVGGASIQPWSTTPQGHSLGAWGLPASTGIDGRFHGLLIPSTNAMLSVRAPRYEEVLEFDLRPKSPSGDIGDVGLARLQTLTVRLLAPPGLDLARYQIRADTETVGPLVTPDAGGLALLESTDSGLCRVNVFPPDGGRIQTDVDLVAGQDWLVQIPVGSDRTVVTEVKAEAGHELPDVMWINGVFASPGGGTYHTYLRVGDDGRTEFTCATGQRAIFEVMDAVGKRLATRSISIGQASLSTVAIEVAPRCLDLRFVDGEGQPIAQALVSHWVTQDPLDFHHNLRTDADGTISVCDYASERISVVISTEPLQGREHVIDLRALGAIEGPLVVRIDGSSSVLLQLLEDGQPAPNVRAGLRPHGIANITKHRVSDAAGEIRYEGLERGDYEVNVQGNGWWPVTLSVDASPTPSPTVIPVRRKGSVRFEVTQAGLPVAGARLELESLTPGDDLASWPERGWIEVTPATWSTDVTGTLRVLGLPAGPYAWRAVSADGSNTGEGRLEVVGQAEASVPVTLP